MSKLFWHVTIHNNDGQMIDYTALPLVNSETLFPEALKAQAKFTLDNGEIGVWIYDDKDLIDQDTAIALARWIARRDASQVELPLG